MRGATIVQQKYFTNYFLSAITSRILRTARPQCFPPETQNNLTLMSKQTAPNCPRWFTLTPELLARGMSQWLCWQQLLHCVRPLYLSQHLLHEAPSICPLNAKCVIKGMHHHAYYDIIKLTIKLGLFQSLHFSDKNIMERVDWLTLLLNISSNAVWYPAERTCVWSTYNPHTLIWRTQYSPPPPPPSQYFPSKSLEVHIRRKGIDQQERGSPPPPYTNLLCLGLALGGHTTLASVAKYCNKQMVSCYWHTHTPTQ